MLLDQLILLVMMVVPRNLLVFRVTVSSDPGLSSLKTRLSLLQSSSSAVNECGYLLLPTNTYECGTLINCCLSQVIRAISLEITSLSNSCFGQRMAELAAVYLSDPGWIQIF